VSGTTPRKRRASAPQTPVATTVSVVVVSYHTGPSLDGCLRSVLADPWVSELILVDNGNPPEISSRLRGFAADRRHVVLIQGQGNVGFARGANLGAQRATSRLVLFLNPDARLEPGALKLMIEESGDLRSLPAWIIGGRVLGNDGREQRGARREAIGMRGAMVAALGLGWLERMHPGFRDPHRERDPLPPAPTDMGAVSGAFMLTQRAGFLRLGGFDERYFLHVEDIDLCRRVTEGGGRVLFHPDARCFHVGASSQVPSLFVARAKAVSFLRYFRKFARTPLRKVLATGAGLAIGAGLLLRAALGRGRPRR
jgi:GT2 family glycosyltransferase